LPEDEKLSDNKIVLSEPRKIWLKNYIYPEKVNTLFFGNKGKPFKKRIPFRKIIEY